MAEKAGRTADPVRVLVKAMAMLELLAESAEELSLGEIAARLELNKSTCHRILTTLAAGEFVERPSPGTYRLGIGAFRVGSAMARRITVRERALPAMQELYRRSGETIFLLVLRGGEAVCVERLDGRYASTHTLRVGGTLALHLGAGPRLLLAELPDAEVERHALPWDEVRRIRRDGFATSEDDVEKGVKALSVPVRDHEGRVVAALSLSGLSAHLPATEQDEQLAMLREAAALASQAMGWRG